MNSKIYIGVHKTFTPHKFDGYLGNGCYINGTGRKYNNTPFQLALKKYGVENFTRMTLAVKDSEYEAYALEAYIVDTDFVKRKDTYNVIIGGKRRQITTPVAKYDLNGRLLAYYESKEIPAKELHIASTTIDRVCNEVHFTCSGYFWRHIDGEIPDTINIPKNFLEIKKDGLPIVQYSKDGHRLKTWSSAKQVAKDLHYDRATITAACRGKKVTAAGYQWRYQTDNLSSLPPVNSKGGKKVAIVILQEGVLIKSFGSIISAVKGMGVSKVSIHKALKSGRLCYGYTWKRIEVDDMI